MSSWVAKIWQHIETKAKCFNDILPLSCPSNPTIASPPKSEITRLKWDGKLALWKPGHETWTDIPSDNGDTVFEDIAAYNGQLYATDSNDGFYMIDGNKGRLITKTSDHAIFDSNTKGEDKMYTSTGSSLSLVEYDGQLCLFKPNDSQGNKVIMGHRKGGDHEQTWEWEVINSLRNKILFKINEVSFTLPVHLLDRKFQGDWICDCNATWAQRTSLSNGIVVGDFPETERGLESLESIFYPRYNHNFDKVLTTTSGFHPLHSFYHLPNDEYFSLFFPPPPWLQCYSLDPHQDFPPVRFDQCYFPKYFFERRFHT